MPEGWWPQPHRNLWRLQDTKPLKSSPWGIDRQPTGINHIMLLAHYKGSIKYSIMTLYSQNSPWQLERQTEVPSVALCWGWKTHWTWRQRCRRNVERREPFCPRSWESGDWPRFQWCKSRRVCCSASVSTVASWIPPKLKWKRPKFQFYSMTFFVSWNWNGDRRNQENLNDDIMGRFGDSDQIMLLKTRSFF